MNEPVVLLAESANSATITLRDGLELADVPLLHDAARAAIAAGRPVVVECEDLPFLSTAVVQVMIALRRACRNGGLSFTVSGAQDTAIAYLRLAGLEDVLSA